MDVGLHGWVSTPVQPVMYQGTLSREGFVFQLYFLFCTSPSGNENCVTVMLCNKGYSYACTSQYVGSVPTKHKMNGVVII